MRIDTGQPRQALTAADLEAESLRDGERVLGVEEYEAEERERLAWEDAEAARPIADWLLMDEAEVDDSPLRERDLAPLPPSVRKIGESLTSTQRRAQASGGDIPRRPAALFSGEDGHEHVPPWKAGDDLRGDNAAKWLRDHDPDHDVRVATGELAEEVSVRIAGVIYFALGDKATVGISREDVRAAFAPGRPTEQRRRLRSALRGVLVDLYADGARRDLLADELGCSRQALHTLMTKP